MSECFNIDILDNLFIKVLSIKKDSSLFDYVMEVELVIPEQDINKTFHKYKNMQKLTEVGGWFDSQIFIDWEINKNNLDYEYRWAENARRTHFLGLGETQTQKSPNIIFTKPVNGKVTVFLSRDKLGWE